MDEYLSVDLCLVCFRNIAELEFAFYQLLRIASTFAAGCWATAYWTKLKCLKQE